VTPSFTIVAVANKWSDAPYHIPQEWMSSIKRYGIEPVVLGLAQEWKGLMSKPRYLRQWLRDGHCRTECLIFTDAWDLVFCDHPRHIADLWDIKGRPYLMNAERSCFPRNDWSERFIKGQSTFRYPNSGFIVASPQDHLKVLEAMNLESVPDDGQDPENWHPNDQEHFQRMFLDQPVKMVVDDKCEFCQTMHGVPEEILDFSGKVIRNTETNSYPLAVHFNGSKDEVIMDKVLKHLKLR